MDKVNKHPIMEIDGKSSKEFFDITELENLIIDRAFPFIPHPCISDVFSERGYRIGKYTYVKAYGIKNSDLFIFVVVRFRENNPPRFTTFSALEVRTKAWEKNVRLPQKVKDCLGYLYEKLITTRKPERRKVFSSGKAIILKPRVITEKRVFCWRKTDYVNASRCESCDSYIGEKNFKPICRLW